MAVTVTHVSVVAGDDADDDDNDDTDNADMVYDNYTDHHLEAESRCMVDNDKICTNRAWCAWTHKEIKREMKRSRLRGEADSPVGKEVK